MKMRQLTVILLVLAPLPGLARAQGPDSTAADALYREGRDLLQRGDHEQACSRFIESQRIEPATGTLLAVANCHAQQGKLATAWSEFSDVVWRSQQEGREDRAAFAKTRVEELEPRLSALTLQLGRELADIPGLRVRLDGKELDAQQLNRPMFVDGGEHSVEIGAPGHVTEHRSTQIRPERDRVTLALPVLQRGGPGAVPEALPRALPPAAAAPSSPGLEALPAAVTPPQPAQAAPVPSDSGWTPGETAGLTMGIVGVTGLALSGIFLGAALSKKDAAQAHCTGDVCLDEGLALRAQAVRRGNWATGFGVGGLLLAGVGFTLYAVGGRDERAHSASVSLSGEGVRAHLQGSF